MNRITLHWTAGSYQPSPLDRKHYHFLIDGNGKIHEGDHPVSDNIPPLKRGRYAAHAAYHNSNNIGVSVCSMHGAKESPFDAGKYPVRQVQIDALVKLCGDLCKQYDIPVDMVKCHSELPRQSGKWDINWLPDMLTPSIVVGKELRELISNSSTVTMADYYAAEYMQNISTLAGQIKKTNMSEKKNFLMSILSFILALLRKRK